MRERDFFFTKDVFGRLSTAPHRTRYLVLVPTAIAAVFLAIFFFAVFAALFVAGSIGMGIWFWWLRRKLRKAAAAGQPLEGEYTVIEKHTSIIERRDPFD